VIAALGFGKAKGLNEMETNPNAKNTLRDDAYYVSAADLADKLIVLMLQGIDPLLLNKSTWALVNEGASRGVEVTRRPQSAVECRAK